MAEWHVLGVFESEDTYEDYRDDSMCCAAVFNTVVFSFCRMCIGEHTMIERRLLCSSPTCKDFGDCDVVWKVRECKARDQWDVKVNRCGHARGAVPCSVIPPPRVTNLMRQYITLQDECGVPQDNTQKEVDDATEEDNVRKQKDLYTKAAKWSLRRAHRSGMPTEGWTVDLQRKACSCKYFSKFLTCIHIVIALRKQNLVTAASGKLKNRVIGKAKSKTTGSARKATAKEPRRRPKTSRATSSIHDATTITGRPPLASQALAIQEMIAE